MNVSVSECFVGRELDAYLVCNVFEHCRSASGDLGAVEESRMGAELRTRLGAEEEKRPGAELKMRLGVEEEKRLGAKLKMRLNRPPRRSYLYYSG
ncbi:unnamed protein product [Nippostrongylus brasiliensis]|uniref:Uncharacterized protein n=1 Tax=Nippostrongylus brasiliensis TaxID=27835 RepID=A0A0N4YAG5_NIPBR|nr:unnamed protein product [Nippostrongylus brasiliensis]